MSTSEIKPKRHNRVPPQAGKGRPPGFPNKATRNAREAIAALVDNNAERLQGWLDQIAEDQGPFVAWKCVMDVIEYHIPKLQRTEHAGGITVTSISQELAALNKAAGGAK